MININAIHANFSVDNLSVAKDFYIDKLGFKLLKEHSGQAVLESGNGTKVVIYEKADHEPWNSTVLGIEVPDLADAVGKLKELNIEIAAIEGTDENGIIHDPEFGDAAWFQDPAGNWVCVSTII